MPRRVPTIVAPEHGFRHAARVAAEVNRPLRARGRFTRQGAASWPILLVLLLVAIGLGVLLWTGIAGRAAGSNGSRSGVAPSEDQDASILAARVMDCRKVGDSLVTVGSLRNASTITVRYVEVGAAWLDAVGDTVDSKVLYVVGGETLMYGDSVPFRAATANPQATDCRADLFSYDAVP